MKETLGIFTKSLSPVQIEIIRFLIEQDKRIKQLIIIPVVIEYHDAYVIIDQNYSPLKKVAFKEFIKKYLEHKSNYLCIPYLM